MRHQAEALPMQSPVPSLTHRGAHLIVLAGTYFGTYFVSDIKKDLGV